MRRFVDVVVALAVGLVALPIVAVVALLVALDIGRPVLFRQHRAGLAGRPFTLVKFRTMRDADYHGQEDIERITRIGHFLRASGLDELPQLWNILVGEMSFIGPRPALAVQAEHFSQRQRGRLGIRPGLTGWAQVNGRNAISWAERIELDLWYIANRSLRLDMTILLRTVARVVRPTDVRGDNGVNEGFRTESGELIDIWSNAEAAKGTGVASPPPLRETG
ncbi:sugar transferase [Pseudonocardia sp. TRM90224]|uniref:sugar transferase n=1 Tax=Pseudonocardia sp. TRM90224 TaxID=2812678 RepID=UPI001E65DE21|nr:sugar transferase [Pseudonocardia sp. TRM90224]